MSNQKSPNFPCFDCHTDCCKEYTIFVNSHDVYRLSNGLNCKPETFLELIGAKDYSLGIKMEEGLVDLALKQNNGGCKFLEETDDVFRCTVNDFKPGVCKSYPFEIKNGKLAQMSDIMCPTDWDLSGFKEMMMPHLKKVEFEWKFYDDLVREWNSKYEGQPLSKFLEFMLNQVELSLKVQ